MSSASESKDKLLLIWSLTLGIQSHSGFKTYRNLLGITPEMISEHIVPEREPGKHKASRNRPHLVSLGFKLVPSTVSCLSQSFNERVRRLSHR